MGLLRSLLMTEIFVDNFENDLFKSNNSLINKVVYWYRYVFCIFNSTTREILHLHTFHRKALTRTLEKKKKEKIIGISVRYADNPNQSKSIKLTTFHSLIHKLLSITID